MHITEGNMRSSILFALRDKRSQNDLLVIVVFWVWVKDKSSRRQYRLPIFFIIINIASHQYYLLFICAKPSISPSLHEKFLSIVNFYSVAPSRNAKFCTYNLRMTKKTRLPMLQNTITFGDLLRYFAPYHQKILFNSILCLQHVYPFFPIFHRCSYFTQLLNQFVELKND